MIEQLVPAAVVTVGTTADLTTALFAREARALGRAVGSRRREFQTGRACARAALAGLGYAETAVGAGVHGEPLWPAGVVGSITHCDGYRACAVARARDLRGVGIDAEPHAALPGGVLAAVAAEDERRWLQALPAGICWDRLLFSAKEAVFKAWFPLTGRRLGFDDAELVLDPRAGTFSVRVRGESERLNGRWRVAGGIAATAVVVV